jgi:hypothetical protein
MEVSEIAQGQLIVTAFGKGFGSAVGPKGNGRTPHVT